MAESELSREELKLTKEKWKVKSKVEIYSSSMQKWVKGHIVRIFEDEEGEWLVIKYGANNEKEIQRYSQGIRPIKSVKSKRKKVQIPNTSLCCTYSPIPSDFPSFSLQQKPQNKETKTVTKRKPTLGDALKMMSKSLQKTPEKPSQKSPEKSSAKPMEDEAVPSPTTPDLAAEAKRRMEASINAKVTTEPVSRDTDPINERLKKVGNVPNEETLAQKASAIKAKMKEMMADISADEEEKRRLQKEEEKRLKFIEEQEQRRSTESSKPHRAEPSQSKTEDTNDNIPWCTCIGALYDADTLKCKQCGKTWHIPESDPQSADDLEHELELLYKKKGQRILLRVTDHDTFGKARKEEQAVIMQLICMLLEMRRVAQPLYQLYLEEEEWAEKLMEVYHETVTQ